MTQFEKYLREFELAAKAIRIAIDAGNYHMIRFATKAAASSLDQMVKHLPADIDADIDAETDVPHTTVSHDRKRRDQMTKREDLDDTGLGL